MIVARVLAVMVFLHALTKRKEIIVSLRCFTLFTIVAAINSPSVLYSKEMVGSQYELRRRSAAIYQSYTL